MSFEAVVAAALDAILVLEHGHCDQAFAEIRRLRDALLHTQGPEDPPREQPSCVSLRSARNKRYYESRRSKTLASEIQTPKTSESVLQASEKSLSHTLSLLSSSKDSKEIEKERELEREKTNSDASKTPKTLGASESKTRIRVAVRPPPSDASWETVVAWCETYRVPTNEREVLEVWLDEQRNAKTAKRDPRAAWNRNAPRIRDELARAAAQRARLNGSGTPPMQPVTPEAIREHQARLRAEEVAEREAAERRRRSDGVGKPPAPLSLMMAEARAKIGGRR